MIIVPKDQAPLNFLLETKELKDGRKASNLPLTPENQDGATWHLTCLLCGGDHITPPCRGGVATMTSNLA